jgi:hypothetical protein
MNSLALASRLISIILPALAALILVPSSRAAAIYETSFEQPTFTSGNVAGQDGWSVLGSGTATVENSFAKTGSQAIAIQGNAPNQSGPYHIDFTNSSEVDLSADLAIFASSDESEWQFAALGPGTNQFIGGIDILGDSIVALTSGLPTIGTFPRATVLTASAWHNINLNFNFTTQTYTISLDGTLLDSNVPFCGDDVVCAGAPVSSYAVGILDSLGGGNDVAYLDNYAVVTPEPSSNFLVLTSLIVGASFLFRRYFRRDYRPTR